MLDRGPDGPRNQNLKALLLLSEAQKEDKMSRDGVVREKRTSDLRKFCTLRGVRRETVKEIMNIGHHTRDISVTG